MHIKKLLSLVLSIVFTVTLSGCSINNKNTDTPQTNSETSSVQVKKTKTIIDHEGIEMEIPLEINRIIIGDIYPLSAALSVYLGGADKIVGIHPESMGAAKSGLLGKIYPEILTAKTDFINGNDINIEELLKLNPDIVIGVSKDKAEAIRNAGIPAVISI